MLLGEQVTEVKPTDAISDTEAVRELPFKLAVTTAVWSLVIVPAVAVNVLELRPAAMVTEAGTVSAPELLDRATAAPLPPAAWLKETVQEEEPAVLSEVGEQDNPVTVGFGSIAVMVPPVPLIGIPVPLAEAPSVFDTPITVPIVTAGEIVTVTSATMPFCIALVFSPATRQA